MVLLVEASQLPIAFTVLCVFQAFISLCLHAFVHVANAFFVLREPCCEC